MEGNLPVTGIHDSEIEDFEEMLQSLGHTADEFEVVIGPTEILAPPGVVGLAVNSIRVTFLRTGISRTYTRGGIETPGNRWPEWVNAVERDISNGAFN